MLLCYEFDLNVLHAYSFSVILFSKYTSRVNGRVMSSSGDGTSASTFCVANMERQLEIILSRILNKEAIGIPKQCSKNDDIKSHLMHIKDYLRACGIEKARCQNCHLI